MFDCILERFKLPHFRLRYPRPTHAHTHSQTHARAHTHTHPTHAHCAVLRRACRYESDQGALRALRMVLRDVTTRLLCSRKWEAFAEPVLPEEDPEYWERVREAHCTASPTRASGPRVLGG